MEGEYIEQVLQGIQELGKQLERLSLGQTRVEGTLKKISVDLNSGHTATTTARTDSGARTSVRAGVSDGLLDFDAADTTNSPMKSGMAGTPSLGVRRPQGHSRGKNQDVIMRARTLRPPSFWRANAQAMQETVRIRPVHPDSWGAATMDFLALVVLVYDSVQIPYELAWPRKLTGWQYSLAVSTVCFWCVDLVFGFITGFHSKDGVIMDFKSIGKQYLRHNFFPNLIVIVAEAFGIIQQSLSDELERARQSAYIRLVRFFKLNRLLRLSESFRHGKVAETRDWIATVLQQWGYQEQFNFTVRIVQLVLYIMWVNHIGSCIWQQVGREGTESWYAEFNITPEQEEDWTFQYLLAFWYSASSMISGNSVMMPRNTHELGATVFCVVFGFILSSVLISSLLATVMKHQDANKERNEKLTNLRQFLYQHNIDPKLAVPIVQQVLDRMGTRKQLAEGDVDVLALLSPALRSELWFQLYGSNIKESPFLCACDAMYNGLIKDMCFHVVQHICHVPGTLVFEPGMEASGAYFVCHGSLEYCFVGSPSDEMETDVNFSEESTVNEEAWISEVSLWVHWTHRGWLDVSSPCELLLVEGGQFTQLLNANPNLTNVVKTYSSVLLKALAQNPAEPITDLRTPTYQSLVISLPLHTRILLSDAAMSILAKRRRSRHSGRHADPQSQGMQELRDEIDAGLCDLMVVRDEVQRVITESRLRIRDNLGNILVQIGSVAKGIFSSCCCLPSIPVGPEETPFGAAQRFTSERFGLLKDFVSLEGSSSTSDEPMAPIDKDLTCRRMCHLFHAGLTDEPSYEYRRLLPRLTCTSRQSSVNASGSETTTTGSQYSWRLSTRVGSLTLRRSGSKGSDLLPACVAFVFRNHIANFDQTVPIYAWLRQEDFSLLSSKAGRPLLEKCVGLLDFNAVNQRDSALPSDQHTNGMNVSCTPEESIKSANL